jgi:hypothetical protein
VTHKIDGLSQFTDQCIHVWNQVGEVVIAAGSNVVGLSESALVKGDPPPRLVSRHFGECSTVVEPTV